MLDLGHRTFIKYGESYNVGHSGGQIGNHYGLAIGTVNIDLDGLEVP